LPKGGIIPLYQEGIKGCVLLFSMASITQNPTAELQRKDSQPAHSPNGKYRIKVVDTIDGFKELKDTWNSLTEKNHTYSPWLSWEWFDLCTKYFLTGNNLYIVLLYKDGHVVAIAPFIIKNEIFKGLLRTRKLELVGCIHSPVRMFLFNGSDRKEKAEYIFQILNHFRTMFRAWDVMEFYRLPEEQAVFNMFKDAIAQIGLKFRAYFSDANWFLDEIHYPSAQYFDDLPKGLQKEIQYCQRRLEKMGSLKFEIKSDDDESLEYYLDLYDKVRAKSWKAPEKDKNFLREFTIASAHNGWLRLCFLIFNDIPIAAQKWLVCNKKAYIWDVVYDEEYKKFSPGSVLSRAICRHVIDEDKVSEIDYMTGDDPYKKSWTPRRREMHGITVFNETLKGQTLGIIMTKALPVIQRQPYLLAAMNKIKQYRRGIP
jgi:CelD/BcsL family acetyltransferase involved in cellulose biosynthesis